MDRKPTNKLCGLILIITTICPLSAWAINPLEADSLHNKVPDDIAFLINTVTSVSGQIAKISFSVKYVSLLSGSLTYMRIELTYDTARVQYESAYKDSTNWDGDLTVNDTTLGELVLTFDNGSVTTFDTSGYTTYSFLQFKLKRQGELSSSDLILVKKGSDSYITVSTVKYLIQTIRR